MQMRNTVSLQCARGLSAAKKMSKCFDCERTDVTEKSGECLKRSCVVQLTSARCKIVGRCAGDDVVRGREQSSWPPVTAPAVLQLGAQALLRVLLHIPGF